MSAKKSAKITAEKSIKKPAEKPTEKSLKKSTENSVKTGGGKNYLLMIAAGIALCAAVVLMVFGNGRKESPSNAGTQEIGQGEYLTIAAADIGEKAVFYPITVDGTQMEVFAVKASDGSIRTAFNTCQSCYSSGAGYYVQEGTDLVCQNCGFHFTPDQVEIQSGGCNPWPIFEEDKEVSGETIRISYDFLKESTGIFANWKV